MPQFKVYEVLIEEGLAFPPNYETSACHIVRSRKIQIEAESIQEAIQRARDASEGWSEWSKEESREYGYYLEPYNYTQLQAHEIGNEGNRLTVQK